MPIFEYKCKACEAKFEVLVLSGGAGEVTCEACGSPDVAKQMSVFGFSSGGKFTSSTGGGECGDCATHNCGSCGCH